MLEAGEYVFYVGTDVRSAVPGAALTLEETVAVKELEEACRPVTAFERMKPQRDGEGGFRVSWESVPLRRVDPGGKAKGETAGKPFLHRGQRL